MEQQNKDKDSKDNTIYIGQKPAMGYVLAALTQFTNGSPDVLLKARGKLTAKAITVAEVLRNRYLPDAQVSNIKIGTEEVTGEDGKSLRVSSIEIKLSKK